MNEKVLCPHCGAVMISPLLKPLTFEEATDDDAFLEQKGDKYIDAALNQLAVYHDGPEIGPDDCIVYTTHSKEALKLMRKDYGKTWRCWARRPTPEECAAAPWEE